jgi:SAM-dependent methyltransferase
MARLASTIKRVMPLPVKSALRSARDRFRLRSAREHFSKKRLFGPLAPLVPPIELMHDGPQTYLDFKQNAEEFLRLYVDLCGLTPHERMLDVGCGIGRKTLFLTGYLSTRGAYEGIDIVKTGVDWCSRKISSKYPNFRFQLIDVYNKYYHPAGKHRASDYRFPFRDGSFDFVTLGSVFTHMLPKDTENYLAEVRRVLKSEGRCLISWFLLNPESDGLIRSSKSTLSLTFPVEGVCRTINVANPESAIGYNEAYVLGLYERCGLMIRDRVHYGSWCGRAEFLSYQDLVLASPR